MMPKPAATATATAEAPSTGIARAPIEIGGRSLFDISGTTRAEVERRAATVNRRLERLIERPEKVAELVPRDITIEDGQPLIQLGGEPILTVTPDDVADNLIPAPELAQTWGKQLYDAVHSARIARSSPLNNALVVLVTATRDLITSVLNWLPRLLGVLLLALIVWPLSLLTRWLARKATRTPRIDPNLTQLIIAIAFYGTWTLGILAMLSAVGINGAGLAAAVGASGFILAFAFQDVLSHFFAGMLLLMSRQFYIGGRIKVGEHEGFVEGIDLRALYLRTYDNRQVTIPNGQVFNSAVIVNTSNPWRRRDFLIGIGYESDARQAMQLAIEAMKTVDGVLDEPPPQVFVDELGASSVNLRMYFFTAASNIHWLAATSECILRTKETFDQNGINIPYSTHTIDVRHVGELGELLTPLLKKSAPDSAPPDDK